MPRTAKTAQENKSVKKSAQDLLKKGLGEAEQYVEKVENEVKADVAKVRKAYPSHDERVAMAEAQVARLRNLNAKREELIAKTEKTLNERKAALEKSKVALEKVLAKKERILANKVKAIGNSGGVRAAKAAEKQKIAELKELLDKSGKSLDEFVAELKEKL